jgi:hypothetical protein
MKARTPEQTVTVSVEQDAVKVIDPVAKKELKTFSYSGLKVTHTPSNTPPPRPVIRNPRPRSEDRCPPTWVKRRGTG